MLAGATDNLFGHAALLNALDLRLNAAEIVVTGMEYERFAAAALKLSFLNRILLRAPSPDALPVTHPAHDKIKATSGVAAFICVGERCSLPVTDTARIAEVAKEMRG